MKKIVMCAAVGLVTLAGCNREVALKDVPAVISNAFNSKFKNATSAEWEKKNNKFEVEFEVDTLEHTVLYDNAGRMIMHKQEIDISLVPSPLNALFSSKLKNNKIEDIELVEANGKRYFQVEAEEQYNEQKLVFTDSGKETTEFKYWD